MTLVKLSAISTTIMTRRTDLPAQRLLLQGQEPHAHVAEEPRAGLLRVEEEPFYNQLKGFPILL